MRSKVPELYFNTSGRYDDFGLEEINRGCS